MHIQSIEWTGHERENKQKKLNMERKRNKCHEKWIKKSIFFRKNIGNDMHIDTSMFTRDRSKFAIDKTKRNTKSIHIVFFLPFSLSLYISLSFSLVFSLVFVGKPMHVDLLISLLFSSFRNRVMYTNFQVDFSSFIFLYVLFSHFFRC